MSGNERFKVTGIEGLRADRDNNLITQWSGHKPIIPRNWWRSRNPLDRKQFQLAF